MTRWHQPYLGLTEFPADLTTFELDYFFTFTAEEIAGLPGAGLTAKGVESALRRITLWLRGEVEARKLEEAAESA